MEQWGVALLTALSVQALNVAVEWGRESRAHKKTLEAERRAFEREKERTLLSYQRDLLDEVQDLSFRVLDYGGRAFAYHSDEYQKTGEWMSQVIPPNGKYDTMWAALVRLETVGYRLADVKLGNEMIPNLIRTARTMHKTETEDEGGNVCLKLQEYYREINKRAGQLLRGAEPES
jgi:hypothetical protein